MRWSVPVRPRRSLQGCEQRLRLRIISKPFRMGSSRIKNWRSFERFVLTLGCSRGCFLQDCSDLGFIHGAERLGCFKRLVQDLHAVDAGNHDRGRQAKSVMQALDRRCCFASQNIAAGHRFHPQNPDLLLDQNRHNFLAKAAEMRVHHV